MDNELRNIAISTNYITPLNYVSGRIVEYDIASANISMLKQYNAIDDNYYNYLSNLPKYDREVEIGLLIRSDKKYYDIISIGIQKAKEMLFEMNNIKNYMVVRIANDAVYINHSINLYNTQFGLIHFKQKSIWNSMIKLGNIIIFFNFIGDNIEIDVKGLGVNKELHSNFMLSAIANVVYMMERVSTQDALKFIIDLYQNYLNKKLPIEFYREFNPDSLYHLSNSDFYITDPSKSEIDIGYNLYILRELWSIVLDKYNSEIKRN